MYVVEAIASVLARLPSPCAFGLIGDGNLDLAVELTDRHDLPWITARHEQGAAAMADGYTRSGRGIGLALVTHGPGLTNAATSIKEAAAAGTPMLVVAGDSPTGDDEHFQRLDQADVATALVGAAATARPTNPEEVPDAVRRAARHVISGIGPFVLNLPTDVQQAQITGAIQIPQITSPLPLVPPVTLVRAAAKRLVEARRPLILAGVGAVNSGAQKRIEEMGVRLGAPLFTTLRAHGSFHGHPLEAGLAGGFGRELCAQAFAETDCILALGASLSRYTTGEGRLLDGADLIWVDSDPDRLARRPDAIAVPGDISLTVERLLDELGPGPDESPWFDIGALSQSLHRSTYQHGTGTVDPFALFDALDDALPVRRHIVVDAGHFTTFACGMLSIAHPDDLVFPVNFGAVGQGLATAIGTALAHPDERVTAVVGDGGFLLGLAEFDTAVRLDIPLTVLVVNDEAYGQEVHVMRARGLPTGTAQARSPDLAAVARSFGAQGCTITSTADLGTLPARLAAARGVMLVDARVNPAVRNWRIDERFGE